jgi:hypothetical protein
MKTQRFCHSPISAHVWLLCFFEFRHMYIQIPLRLHLLAAAMKQSHLVQIVMISQYTNHNNNTTCHRTSPINIARYIKLQSQLLPQATILSNWNMKVQSIGTALLNVVALSWQTHRCHATIHSDIGSAMILNETFPSVDVTVQRSHVRGRVSRRREQDTGVVSGIRNFKPLTCNSEILKVGAVCSRTWSSMFGTSDTHTNRLIIPCGVCIVMNHASGTLNLNGGIDIQGKLVVPEDFSISITTTTIIVQGELSMTSTKSISGTPKIKVMLVGSKDIAFTPIDVNANACQGLATCNGGKKSFIVAGGKVTCMYNLRLSG